MGFSLILACMMCVRVWLVQGIPLNPEKENILLDMKDFRYLTRPDQSDCGEELFLQILVQSRPSRFRQRQTIRDLLRSAQPPTNWDFFFHETLAKNDYCVLLSGASTLSGDILYSIFDILLVIGKHNFWKKTKHCVWVDASVYKYQITYLTE